MKEKDFHDKLNNINNSYNDECEMEISFQPLADKETGEIIAIVQIKSCAHCGESYVSEIFTKDEEGELLAIELGFRDNSLDEGDEGDED